MHAEMCGGSLEIMMLSTGTWGRAVDKQGMKVWMKTLLGVW